MTLRVLPILLLASPAGAFELAFPVACTPGEDCYFQNLVDHDSGPGATDATCGPLTYDGHDGTDIALPTLADQARGVDVLAAAAGVVVALRDGQPDVPQGRPDSPDVSGVECGNGVLIRHPEGWETQYCHMAQGSIAVTEGQQVAAGDVLGRIGLSGNTEFPHLEISVRREGQAVDPFAPEAATSCGAPPASTLWAAPVPFPQGGPTSAGFAAEVPAYEAVLAGTAGAAGVAPAEPLVLFGLFYGGRAGDLVRLTVTGPDGSEVVSYEEPIERTQALLFRAAGLRAPEGGWPPGAYRGVAALLRNGAELGTRSAETEMPER